ncbi:hypothetical protein [Angustibacter aerolatus]|uniref:Uncharacterized protein n=1 Tax=Angustibacter aerolatus TaxID=1162965 RepID=A0ABQ6JG11_9ACTN|nr:hypothetical protein GCM10025868_19790 [Angustibacter aerolatus]
MTPPTSTPPASTAPAPASTTVTGVVEDGVEARCLLLRGGGTEYLLLGDHGLRAGDRATVSGTVARGVASYCQQGVPLRVTRVESVQRSGTAPGS